jgi:tetratricopeptide (TPR) repeat protein
MNASLSRLYFATRVLLLTPLFLISVFVQAQTIQQHIQNGDKLYSKKNYKAAIEAYQEAIKINPDDASLNFKLGLAYLYSDTKSKAASFIDKAYKLNPNIDNRIDYHLGIAFQNTNDFKRAIEHFQYSRKKNPQVSTIADERIAECYVADSLTQLELNVIIENIGLL